METKYWLGLKMVVGIDNYLKLLVAKFGKARKIWEAKPRSLLEAGLPFDLVERLVALRSQVDLDRESDRLTAEGVRILTLSMPSYPAILKQITYPPRVLFVKGNLLTQYDTAVAVVGARRATAYGKAVAEEIAEELAKAGVTVVSGLALGIDTCAHRGALAARRPARQGVETSEANPSTGRLGEAGGTIGVLGCGLDVCYPPSNRKLFKEIGERGSLVTEYAPDTVALPYHFPTRNRIISGLSKAVLVVEAAARSGSLITADFALEQGRDVFAVPGHVKSDLSKGTHALIKQGALLVEGASDILEALGLRSDKQAEDQSLDQQERAILEAVGWERATVDQILVRTAADISKLSSQLVLLEVKGYLRQDYGGAYVRIR